MKESAYIYWSYDMFKRYILLPEKQITHTYVMEVGLRDFLWDPWCRIKGSIYIYLIAIWDDIKKKKVYGV
jgi:hypothetical protein